MVTDKKANVRSILYAAACHLWQETRMMFPLQLCTSLGGDKQLALAGGITAAGHRRHQERDKWGSWVSLFRHNMLLLYVWVCMGAPCQRS